MLRIHRRKKSGHPSDRQGSVAVEAALCMLVIVPIMFGTLEICSGYYLAETVSIAAYEGARFGARDLSTPNGVREYCQSILRDRGVDPASATIQVEPSSFSGRHVLDPITVTISCPTNGNSLFVFSHVANRTISATTSIASEVGNPPRGL